MSLIAGLLNMARFMRLSKCLHIGSQFCRLSSLVTAFNCISVQLVACKLKKYSAPYRKEYDARKLIYLKNKAFIEQYNYNSEGHDVLLELNHMADLVSTLPTSGLHLSPNNWRPPTLGVLEM